MKKPGCAASCTCKVLVAHFMAPMMMKSGLRYILLLLYSGAARHFKCILSMAFISVLLLLHQASSPKRLETNSRTTREGP